MHKPASQVKIKEALNTACEQDTLRSKGSTSLLYWCEQSQFGSASPERTAAMYQRRKDGEMSCKETSRACQTVAACTLHLRVSLARVAAHARPRCVAHARHRS